MGIARMGAGLLVRVGISLGVLAGLLMTVFALAPEGQAAFPGDNGKIVFIRYDINGASSDIYVMNSDGSEVVNLTNSPEQESSAVWSPDGKKIAFRRIMGDYHHYAAGDVYVMNSDGSGQTNLTNHPASDDSPAWSPDGKKIAFTSNRANDRDYPEIFIMNADGTDAARLASGYAAARNLAWSPDGSKIAFNNISHVYAVSTSGGTPVRLTTNVGRESYNRVVNNADPSWSPDGSTIAFYSNSYKQYPGMPPEGYPDVAIFTVKADGSGQTRLSGEASSDSGPAWSPDGSKIAYVNGGIRSMSANGSGQIQLTQSSYWEGQPDWQPVDATPPTVTNVQPSGTIYTSTTEVSVDYVDAGSGIDAGSVTVTIDGHRLVDCVATDSQVRCPAEQFMTIPEHVGPSGLAYGSHTIGGSVADQSGNVAPIQGSFFVGDNTPPRVGDVQPSGTIEESSTTVSAGFVDDIADIDPGSVVVTLDGRTLSGCSVTALGWEAWESGWTHQVSCLADNLAPGPHKIGGTVADQAGNHSQIKGSFTIVPSYPVTQNGPIGLLLNWAIGLILGDNGLLGILRSL